MHVMLEKIAGVALMNKLRAILLIEGDYNYFNKWVFGREAINVLYEMGYIPEDQYSHKKSTAEDAKMDNRLTMDISRQTRHPMVSTSADAANCYDQINHIITAYLLLAITGSVRLITSLLFPIQIKWGGVNDGWWDDEWTCIAHAGFATYCQLYQDVASNVSVCLEWEYKRSYCSFSNIKNRGKSADDVICID